MQTHHHEADAVTLLKVIRERESLGRQDTPGEDGGPAKIEVRPTAAGGSRTSSPAENSLTAGGAKGWK